MKLYFGNAVTTATTLALVALLVFIGRLHCKSRRDHPLGAQKRGFVGIRPRCLLPCSGAGRAGQDDPARY